jgi:lipid II isoglutaminyl synthase (glutamine-hydrolysing)
MMNLKIGYLYGDLMNIYGDTGNITSLKKRAEWRGIEVELEIKSLKSKIKKGEIDLFFFGGGQDQSQEVVAKDLQDKAEVLNSEIERGVPLLAICGGYQLLGDYYQPFDGPKLKGIGLFPIYTKASNDRMIGNIVIESTIPQTIDHKPYLVGFENHSGKTYLKEKAKPLGKVVKGFGNNGDDKTEGCIYMNAIGCYMHGPLLPKNPQLADWLIKKALEIKYGKEIELEPLDDELENKAHNTAVSRFR